VGVSATLLAVVLVGCTPVSEPSPSRAPYVMPQIVGETVSDSPLEEDEWVIATRAATLGTTLAYNAADFSIEPYASTWTSHSQREIHDDYLWFLRDYGVEARPGPPVMVPLGVEVHPSKEGDPERATVSMCQPIDAIWTDDPVLLADAGRIVYDMVRQDDGRIVGSSSSSYAAVDPCDASAAPIARFDPAPASLSGLTADDVVPPPAADDGRGS
jgi:hypothetical protein